MEHKKFDDLMQIQQETLDKCEEYYDAVSKKLYPNGVIWLKNDETGQLMVYTRGEYTEEILNFISKL